MTMPAIAPGLSAGLEDGGRVKVDVVEGDVVEADEDVEELLVVDATENLVPGYNVGVFRALWTSPGSLVYYKWDLVNFSLPEAIVLLTQVGADEGPNSSLNAEALAMELSSPVSTC